jgi:uncharacterized membrane protein
MILWHTADAWLEPALRDGVAFRWLRLTGGLAAPLFLLLAGVAVGLVEPAVHDRGSTLGALRRAGQIAVLGYALKLFAFGVDRAGLIGPHAIWVIAGGVGLGCLHQALGSLPERLDTTAHRAGLGILGVVLYASLLHALREDPRALELVLRLDVLQGIGACLFVLALVMPATARSERPSPLGPVAALVVSGIGVALATPSLGALDLHLDAAPLQKLLDYVARVTPYPSPTGARFPMFPWLAYALLGAAVGRSMRGRSTPLPFALPTPLRAPLVLLMATLTAIAFFEPNPLPQLLLAPGELVRNLVRVIFNVAIAMAVAGAVATFAAHGRPPARALALLGRHSLLVYAVHLEIAYGLLTVPMQHALSYWTWAFSAVLLFVAMVGLSWALERRPRNERRVAGSSRAMQA